MNLLTLEAPLGSEIMTTVRLATGGVCSAAGLDLDRSEDCKVCVTESLLLIGHAGFSRARILFVREGGLTVTAEGIVRDRKPAPVPEDEISAALLGALAENVTVLKEDGLATKVTFSF